RSGQGDIQFCNVLLRRWVGLTVSRPYAMIKRIVEPETSPPLAAHELAAACGRLLVARGWRLAVAESCTGGLLGDTIPNVPGCSAWFVGGIIAYADAI